MKYARILDITFLNELIPLEWPNSHELNEQEEVINQKTFGEYLIYASGKSAVRTVMINGSVGFVTPFTHKSTAILDALVNSLVSDKIELITEQEFRNFLNG